MHQIDEQSGGQAWESTCQLRKSPESHGQEVLPSPSQQPVFESSAVSRNTQTDRLLNTPAPLVDKTRTTHCPYHSLLLLVQNNNSVQQQLIFPHSACHQNALQPALQCRPALLRRPGSLLLSK
ncbi:hypothetical protein E2C01_038911 [Portunus trituberculatus]|uniref:Uncharacterized protein n=1 Tax=Portunus trituberculatus TaxID=210409 RepID=A0A5B7FJ82_PORTR|nr:hypothetical protein [Portunus trituberculatus]